MKFWLTNKSRKPAFYIAGLYFTIGLLWIFISDRTTPEWLESPDGQLLFQTLKGGFFVLTTSLLLYFLILKQVHKRNQLIHLLKTNNNLLNQILDKNIGVDILIINDADEIAFARGDSKIWSGKSTSELLGLKLNNNLMNGFDFESFKKLYTQLWESRTDIEQEINISGFWYKMHGAIIKYKIESEVDKDMVLLIFMNVSNEKSLEDEVKSNLGQNEQNIRKITQLGDQLKEADERFKVLADNLYNGIILCTANHNGAPGRIIEINSVAKNIFDKNGDGTDLDRLKDVMIFDDEYDAAMLFKNDYRQKKQVVIKSKVSDSNSQKPIELIGRLLSTQTSTYIVIIIRDIQKETETQVNSLNLDFNTILNSFTLGVMLIKPDGRCFFINQYMKDHLNMDLSINEEINLANLAILGGDIDISQYFTRCMEGEIVQIPHHPLGLNQKNKFGSTLYPIKNSKGKTEAVLRITTDVSFVYDFEEKLLNQKASIDESTKLRTVFLSNLSHEIRTPMNGIQGFVELLENENLNQTQWKYLQYIRQSSENLLDMLNALIEMSQLENKEVTIYKKWVDIQEIRTEIESYVKDESEKLGRTNLKIKEDIPNYQGLKQVFTDKDKIIKIWKILIGNALKFTQQGVIEYGLTLDDDGKFEFWTSDTGIGIKAYNLNAVFLPFASFNISEQVVFGGLGLGLSIARAYTDLLGGEIFIESKEMEGSRFTVSLPLTLMGDSMQEEITLSPLLEKIMIVQHGIDGSNELIENLESLGVKTIYVQNGAMAIEILMEQEDIDMVICDTRLSDMDGIELIRVIKRIRKRIPVIAQTFFFINEERKKYLNAGFEDYLLKPINKSLLYSWITKGK
jgi:signal transduction histidine kinase/CheY-like chemotaxis protein/PAS domain-containing protein